MGTFNFDGQLSVVIKIKDNTYTLVSDTTLGTGAAKVNLKYQAASLDESIVLGKMGDLVNTTDTLLDEIGKALNITGQFGTGFWTDLTAKAKLLPGFGPVFTDVLNTDIRITTIGLELDAPLSETEPISKGKVTFGIAFDSRNAAHNAVLGIHLQSIGILLSFSYGG